MKIHTQNICASWCYSRQTNGICCSQLTYHSVLLISSSKTQPSLEFGHERMHCSTSPHFSLMCTCCALKRLVFNSPKIVPNHHYGLHLPEQLGKNINRMLQQMNTNGIIQRFQFQTSGLLLQNEHGADSIQPKQKVLVKVHPNIYGVFFSEAQL
ncbi:hypothetical protein VP01_7g3 [Puccinia sorghi]|uniref:Uncharacterized protein n=1 Tax=Puccinia sorghi TaxID=27349 RepID=A0A0L6UAH6_9BASI|nr:hypothetical protein VP01_7g3 [Puccinia sorghi]